MKEKLQIKGVLTLTLTDEFGRVKERREQNLVVSVGRAWIASRLKDASAAVMSHMAVGTTNTAAAAGDTALAAELSRIALTSSTLVTQNVANDSLEYVATYLPGVATGALVEAGLFNDPAAGTMLSRVVFAVVNKTAPDTLTIAWRIVVQ